mgnify:CR=1 FL=1
MRIGQCQRFVERSTCTYDSTHLLRTHHYQCSCRCTSDARHAKQLVHSGDIETCLGTALILLQVNVIFLVCNGVPKPFQTLRQRQARIDRGSLVCGLLVWPSRWFGDVVLRVLVMPNVIHFPLGNGAFCNVAIAFFAVSSRGFDVNTASFPSEQLDFGLDLGVRVVELSSCLERCFA